MEDNLLVYFGGEVKALGDGKLGGYLVRFSTENDPDLTGDYFTKSTDFGEVDKLPVMYHHGLDAKFGKRKIGKGDIHTDDVGVWIESQLALRDEYEKAIYELAEKGKLGWSSGAAGHTVDRAEHEKANEITQWYIAEASLTPTPAEPRNSAVPIKSLFPAEPAPMEDEVPPAESLPVEKSSTESIPMEVTNTMSDTPETVQAPDLAEELKALKAELEALKAQPVNPLKAAPAVISKLGQPDLPKSFKAWMKGDPRALKGLGFNASETQVDMREGEELKAAMQEGTTTEGGFAVQNDFLSRVIAKRTQLSVVEALIREAGGTVYSTDRDYFDFVAESTAMTKMVITAEEAAYDENEPTLAQPQAQIFKFTKLIKVSEELMEDANSGLEAFLVDGIGRAAALTENYYTFIGTGTSQPQGVMAGGTAGLTFDDTNSIAAAEVPELFWKLPSGYHNGAAWAMRGATMGAFQGLTGNNFQFVPQVPVSINQGGQVGYSFWGGKPAYVCDDIAAIATGVKTLVVGNWAYYGFVRNRTLSIMRNPYLYQANGQIGIFARLRFGGIVLQAEAFQYGTQA